MLVFPSVVFHCSLERFVTGRKPQLFSLLKPSSRVMMTTRSLFSYISIWRKKKKKNFPFNETMAFSVSGKLHFLCNTVGITACRQVPESKYSKISTGLLLQKVMNSLLHEDTSLSENYKPGFSILVTWNSRPMEIKHRSCQNQCLSL